jgi:hypothetical protein
MSDIAVIDPIGTGSNLIRQTCWTPDMPNEVYHGDCCIGPSISASSVKAILSDPAEFWRTSAINQHAAEREVKQAFSVGTTAHTMVLEPELLAETIAVVPAEILASNGALSTKAAKEFVIDQTEAGRTVVTPDQWDAVCSMAENIKANGLVMRALEGGIIEPSLFVRDEETGLFMKSRPDVAPAESGRFIVDLKTTDHESIAAWEKAATVDLRYDIQGALMMNHVQKTMNVTAAGVMYVVSCKKEPHRVGVRVLRPNTESGQDLLATGWADILEAQRIFNACWSDGVFPSPWDSVSDLEPPEFRRRQIVRALEDAGYPETPFSHWGEPSTW